MDLPATQVLDCSSDDVQREQVGTLSVGSINYPVLLGINKIGRHPGCHIVINHNTVSKEHAEIEAGRGNDTFICDLRSANRTVINNRCLRPGLFYQLNDGNVITMGQIKATYKVLDDNDDVLMENSIVPVTPANKNAKNKQTNVIPGTPDSSLNNSSTCESDNSVIAGTQREKSNVFRLPSVPAQRSTKNTGNVSADTVEKVSSGISLDDDEPMIDVGPSTSGNASEKEEVSIFDMETESYSQENRKQSQSAFDIYDAETQTFVTAEFKEKAVKVNEEKMVEEITKSKGQEETLNPSQNSNSSPQNFLNVSLSPSPVNIYVGENDERSDTDGSMILIRADDFNEEFDESSFNDSKKQSAGESVGHDEHSKDRSAVAHSSKVHFNVNIDSSNDVNTDIYDAPTQCIDIEKSNATDRTAQDDCETDEEGVFEEYFSNRKSKSPGKSETKDDSETDEEGIFQTFVEKEKGNSNAKVSRNSSIEKSNEDDDLFDALTQKISSEEKEAIRERNKSSLSGRRDSAIVHEEDVDLSTAPTQIPPKDDQQVNIESQPTQILEVNYLEPTERASNLSNESTEHNNVDYEMALTQRIDDLVATSPKATSEKQVSPTCRKTYKRIKKPVTDSEDTEETLNDNIEINLRSMLNESCDNDGAMEHSQMSSQALRNVLESTQGTVSEKSPGTNPETRNKRSLRRKTRAADTSDSVEANLKSILNETSNNNTENCSQLSSQTLLNVLESTQETEIEKSPGIKPETKSRRLLRKKLETADEEVVQKKPEETKDVPAETDSMGENSRSVQSDSKSCSESFTNRLTSSWLDDEVDILAEFPPVNISGTLSNPVALSKPIIDDFFKGTKKPARRTAAKAKRNNRNSDKSIGKRDSPISTTNRNEGEPYRIVKYSLGGSSSRQSSSSLDLEPERSAGSKRKTPEKIAELSDDQMDFEALKNIADRMLAVEPVYGSSNSVPFKKRTINSARKSNTVLPNKLAESTALPTERQSSSLSVSVRGNNMINTRCNKLGDERSSVFQVDKEVPLRTVVKAQEKNSRANTRSKTSKTFDKNVSSEPKHEKLPSTEKQLKVLLKKINVDKQWNCSFVIKDQPQEVCSEARRKSTRSEKRKENKNTKTNLIESKKDDEPGLESQEVDEILTKWSNTKNIKRNEKEETGGRKCPEKRSTRSMVTNTEKRNEITTEVNNESVNTNNSIESNDLNRSVTFEKPTKVPRKTRITKSTSALSESVTEPPKSTESTIMAPTQATRSRRRISATVERHLVDEKSVNDNKKEKDISVALNNSVESTATVPMKRKRGRPRKRKADEVEEADNLANTSVDSLISNISTASVSQNDLSASMLNLMSPSKRRQRVLFTGVMQDDYRKVIQKLGGMVTESPSTCTVLVTDKVRRTFKFLCAMARPVPIVSIEWLIESEKSGHFLDMESYILHDDSAELKFRFNLRESLERAQVEKLLKNYDVLLTPNVAPPSIPELKDILKNCGARPLLKPPTTWNKNTIVISREEDLANAKKFLAKAPKNVPLVSLEFILTGILRHEVDFDEHRLAL